jgi:hypothetical protein
MAVPNPYNTRFNPYKIIFSGIQELISYMVQPGLTISKINMLK